MTSFGTQQLSQGVQYRVQWLWHAVYGHADRQLGVIVDCAAPHGAPDHSVLCCNAHPFITAWCLNQTKTSPQIAFLLQLAKFHPAMSLSSKHNRCSKRCKEETYRSKNTVYGHLHSLLFCSASDLNPTYVGCAIQSVICALTKQAILKLLKL